PRHDTSIPERRARDGRSPLPRALVRLGRGALLGCRGVPAALRMRRDVLTSDKLYGAAATYLLLGVAWAYLYAILQHLEPGSFALGGAPAEANLRELVY